MRVLRPTEKRRWRLYRACQLEGVLGHAAFHSLLGRNTLGVFKAAYAFVAKYGDQFAVVWSSVKEEIRRFLGVMPLVYASWVVPWAEEMRRQLPRLGCLQEEVLRPRIGGHRRVTELGRFRRCQAGARGAHADAWAAFVEDQSDFPVEDLDHDWEIDGAFPEVDMHLMQHATWTVVDQGLWEREEGIFELEARAPRSWPSPWV